MSRFKYKFFYCGLCLVFWVLIICFQPLYDVIRNEIANTFQTEYAYLIYLYEVCLAFVFGLKNFFSCKIAYNIYMITEIISIIILISLILVYWWHYSWNIYIFLLALMITNAVLQVGGNELKK